MHSRSLLLAAALLAPASAALAQGALTPSSAPVPTMKSLDQVESRIPLGAVGGSTDPIMIKAPGSYVLLGNLSCDSSLGIFIGASNVTLDLNGFTVRVTDIDGAVAINCGTATANITVRNGHLAPATGTGRLQFGIFMTDTNNALIEDVTVTGAVGGILLNRAAGKSGNVRRCAVSSCRTGIEAPLVSDCHVVATNDAIVATTATHCRGESVEGAGVSATTADGCTGTSTSGVGLSALLASNCQGRSTSGTGLSTVSASDVLETGTAENCLGTSDSGIGLQTGTASNCTGAVTAFTGSCITIGLKATTATNCRGKASMGLSCTIAQNCHGEGNAVGILATGTASFCHGISSMNAIVANTAVACTAATGSGPIVAVNKQLGTP